MGSTRSPAHFAHNTIFPYARQIGVSESEDWHMTPLIEVAQRGWVEVGKLDEKPTSMHPATYAAP